MFSISNGSKKRSFVEIFGGEGCRVAISLNVSVCPYIFLFSCDLTELLAIRQPFWFFKMVSIIAFSNYVDVKQIYVNTI